MSCIPRRALALIAATLALSVTLAAVPPDKAMYVDGTVPNATKMTEGTLSTTHLETMTFESGAGETITIPYASITSLEYGQKAGRRSGWAILLTPLALFAKKRHHYLTVTYADGAVAHTAQFELGKAIVRTTLKVLEVRTGKEITPWVLTTS
jgi:hypothetical protein